MATRMDGNKKYRNISRVVILTIATLSVVAFYLVTGLRLDYNFEHFLPQNDPEADFYFEFREAFESDNDFAVIAVTRNEGIFDTLFLSQVQQLTNDARQMPYIREVISPTEIKEYRRGPLGEPYEVPLLRYHNTEALKSDSTRIYDQGQWVGLLFSTDARSVAIQMKHKEYLSKEGCDSLSMAMTRLLERYDFDEEHLFGRCMGQKVYVELMFSEMLIFISLSFVLIVIFLIIAFRSTWGVIVPVTVVLLSVLWILGIMKLLGVDIDLMLTVLPTILFVVGMSDVVHILSKYFEELRQGHSKIAAIKTAFREVGLATFLTSVTTAIGFLTLLTSSIQPIRNFGLYTAIGVFVAFILAYSLLPAVMVLLKPPRIARVPASKVFWNQKMHSLLRWVLKKKKSILVASAALTILGLVGASMIQVDNYMVEDLKESHPLKKEFRFFETFLTGGRPFEMAIILEPELNAKDLRVLHVLDSVDTWLEQNYGVRALLSPARMVRQANYYAHNQRETDYRLPDTQQEVDRLLRLARNYDKNGLWNLAYNEEQGFVRISGKVGDFGRSHYTRLNAQLDTFMQELLAHQPGISYHVTGTAHLIDLNNQYLSITMLQGLGIAFLVIALIIGVLFKSWKMVVISLIPNIIPLLLVAGIMGFAGIYLKVSTSIIFTIAFGIAVDDTIHYLSKFRIQLAKGHSWEYALKRTSISTGKAIVVTTLILCGGFLTLIFSDFMGTFYIGTLIGLTLLFAVLADLILLPVLIMLFYGGKKK
ncbi:MAG: RND family transporter [Flavobacteriales bacterium]|nr:RND family transporter [Flavobacteriales bacterium]